MNLESNIVVEDNFFDEQLFRDIKIDLDSKKSQCVWVCGAIWSPELTGSIYVCDASEDIKQRIASHLNLSTDSINTMYYCADNSSGIDWCNDRGSKKAISVYLADNWQSEWGGNFRYLEDDVAHEIVPASNRAVISQGHVMHKVTKIQPGSPLRESLQIFVNYDK